MNEIIEFSKRIRGIFEKRAGELNLPFFDDFPKNCCEGASVLLAVLLFDEFPDRTVKVVHGENEEGDEHHFWVEVDGCIFDLTIDQFKGIANPVYGVSIHPMEHEFCYVA